MTMTAQVFTWIQTNPELAGTVAVAVLAILAAAAHAYRATGSLRQGLLAAMLRFERARRQGQLGAIDGPQVADLVIQWALASLVPGLPVWLRPLFTAGRIRAILQELFDWSLDLLDDGVLNGTRPMLPADDSIPTAQLPIAPTPSWGKRAKDQAAATRQPPADLR